MLSARLLLPDIECRGPDCAVGGGCHEVSAWMEVVMNECVNEEEILGLLGRFTHQSGIKTTFLLYQTAGGATTVG